VCFDTKDTEWIISMVKAIAPLCGGVNLEDIAAPRCFQIGRRLREELDIPVFHDDQHGTAIVVLAALINAARVAEKAITDAHVLAFPGLFRDLLDAAARDITTPMLVAAAEAIANCVGADELDPSYIVPGVFDPRVAPRSPKQSSRRPVPDSTVPSTHRKACAL